MASIGFSGNPSGSMDGRRLYERKLEAKTCEAVRLRPPPFETAVIVRYRPWKYPAGVSMLRSTESEFSQLLFGWGDPEAQPARHPVAPLRSPYSIGTFSHVPNGEVAEVARMPKAMHAQRDHRAAESKANELVTPLEEMKLRTAAELIVQSVATTLIPYYPTPYWRPVRTNDPVERESSGRSGNGREWSEHFPMAA